MIAGARYEGMFSRLSRRGEGAFVPFVVLGDPDRAESERVIRSLVQAGADALELGIPFSDPVADGPAIQAAALRALESGLGVADAFGIVGSVRAEFPDLPIGLLVYANLVVHAGADRFYARAAEAGVDSVLVADAPTLESEPLEREAISHGIAPVLIAPPNAGEERLASIAARSRAYVYVVSRPGVTGAGRALRDDAARVLAALRAAGAAPPLLGFGISTPDHVRGALALGAAGAISGSAVAALIERGRHDRTRMLDEIAAFVRAMKEATIS